MYLSEKKEYIAIDFMKLICAFLVMMIHIQIFETPYEILHFWLTNVLCRLAVPFFFVAAGFFVAKKLENRRQVWLYLKRILILYIIYTVLYTDCILYEYRDLENNPMTLLLTFMKDFFLVGSFSHLWYLLALIYGVIILYLLCVHFKIQEKSCLSLAIALYGVGVLGNAYRNLFYGIPILSDIFATYERVFSTTRNGLFFGFPLILLGYLIYRYQDRIPKKNYWAYTGFFFVLMNVEEYLAKRITHHEGQSMLFSTPLVVVFLFLAVAFIPLPKKCTSAGRFARILSFLIYAWHLFIYATYGYELFGETMGLSGVAFYIMIAGATVITASAIILASKTKVFSWLKYFY